MDSLLTIASVWLALTVAVGMTIGLAIRRAGREPADAELVEPMPTGAVPIDAVPDGPPVVAAAEARSEPAPDRPRPKIPVARAPVAEEPLTATDVSGEVSKSA